MITMKQIWVYHADAFTMNPFKGNPRSCARCSRMLPFHDKLEMASLLGIDME